MMIDAAAVAKCLGISRRMVYDLARDGRLASYRFGDAVRFAPAVVAKNLPTDYTTPLALTASAASSRSIISRSAISRSRAGSHARSRHTATSPGT